ncbi:hypothetical protein [Streptomyces sp. PSAA01]|uniref:hypothetical protein n=1 Tax=Streptomyces sp. PSAA01 TaxID=2912762 RepID=UPI001F3739F0|nr:hypothetical protein [Streptomyces sp. PSAA01]MCG0286120.1 hypothetical protein [Streptomyces sp. PSAA01]
MTDSTLSVGSHLVTANFVNSSDPLDNSSDTTIQQVNQALSTTLRDASNNPISGQTLTFVANSLVGPVALGSAVTNAGGTATLSNVTVPPTILTASTYTASFAGAPGLSPSSGSASLTFQPSPILP